MRRVRCADDLCMGSTATTKKPTRSRNGIARSRAVLRDVEPGSAVDCMTCGERVKFQAKVRPKQVICNVYEKGTWVRVEHYHAACYDTAGEPHGEVDTTPVVKARRAAAAGQQRTA
jgi:hypothetical protein